MQNAFKVTGYTRVVFKVFFPGNSKYKKFTFLAKSGTILTEELIQKELDRLSNFLETKFPMLRYKIVPFGHGRYKQYNFVYVGPKEPTKEQQNEHSSTNARS
jgi:UDP-3-O-[3-hydroxymyristoyl] glucosamine N-acyltransferase